MSTANGSVDTQVQRNRMRALFRDPAFRSAAWRLIMGEGNLAFAARLFPVDATRPKAGSCSATTPFRLSTRS